MTLRKFGYALTFAAAGLLLVGASAPSYAAKAKKKAAAPQQEAVCLHPLKEVCGVKGGQKFTYANACYAANDGATSVQLGPCKVAKAKVAKVMKKPAKKKTDKKM